MSQPVRIWNGLLRVILVVCLLGFLCGVGFLHGPFTFLIVALFLTVILGILWLGAMILFMVEFKDLGVLRLLVALLLPPGAVYGTLVMVDQYPYFISRTYFHNHFEEYQEAVLLARADPGRSESFRLPQRLRKLSIDGEVAVLRGAGGHVWCGFNVGHGLMSPGPVIQFSSNLKLEEGAEELAPGWFFSSRDILD